MNSCRLLLSRTPSSCCRHKYPFNARKMVRYDFVVPGSLMWILKWLLDRLPNRLLSSLSSCYIICSYSPNGMAIAIATAKQTRVFMARGLSLSLCLSCSQGVVRNENPNDLCGRLNDEATTFRGWSGYFLIRHTRCNRQQNDTWLTRSIQSSTPEWSEGAWAGPPGGLGRNKDPGPSPTIRQVIRDQMTYRQKCVAVMPYIHHCLKQFDVGYKAPWFLFLYLLIFFCKSQAACEAIINTGPLLSGEANTQVLAPKGNLLTETFLVTPSSLCPCEVTAG